MSEGLLITSQSLSRFVCLENLSLSSCIATSRGSDYSGLESLLVSLRANYSAFNSLELKGNDLDDVIFRLLTDNYIPIRVLDLSQNNFYQLDLSPLGHFVSSLNCCRLMLVDCSLDNETCRSLIRGLINGRNANPSPASIYVSLQYNRIDNLSVLFPLILISASRWLSGLNLRGNLIGSHALDTTVDPLLLESGLALKESKSSSSTSNSQSPQQSTVRFIPPLPLLFRLLLQQPLATAATSDFYLDLSECGLTCVYSFSFSFSILLLT